MQKCILYIAIFFTIVSCEDPIDITLEEGPVQLVVTGQITDESPARVRLSTTAPYFEEGPTPRISGASLHILEDGQNFDVLTEIPGDPGIYEGNIPGAIGKQYTIEIDIPESSASTLAGTWTSKPERIFPIFEIDSVYLSFYNTPPLPVGDYLNFMYLRPFTFPKDAYYRIKRTINDSAYFQDFLFVNSIEELESFRFRPVIDGIIEPGDDIALEFNSITLAYREYLQVLFQQLNPGGLFDPPPAPIRGNIQEQSGEGRVALGFFSASSVTRAGYKKQE
jgi:hypothetical protein